MKTTPEEAIENMTVIDALYRASGLSPREQLGANVNTKVEVYYRGVGLDCRAG